MKLLINGGCTLSGEIEVDASKNAFLPILASTVLLSGECCFTNYVNLTDLECMREILGLLNIKSVLLGRELYIDTRHIENAKITHELSQKVRASIFILGALLGRFRSAIIAYPGGCNIGARPIDIHIKSFKALGVRIVEKHGYIYCFGENLHSGEVFLDFPSVGATESLMMCGVLLKGVTTIKNAAKEPEIVDLANFLNSCGAHVRGAGTDKIEIIGVESLHGATYTVMPDRIVAGTYLLAVATCGGDVLVKNALAKHNESLLSFLKSACNLDVFSDRIRVKANKRALSIEKIKTLPYPAFPTDLQPQMMVLQSVSQGVCVLQENVFENRFGTAFELKKMGADISINSNLACIVGVEKLFGADVCACDLRCGAALVIAGMKAEGYTSLSGVELIDRGYEKIEEKFAVLGADIKRTEIE